MNDYSNYYGNATNRMLEDAEILFDVQLQTDEGADVKVDGIPCRILIYNHLNDLNEVREERIITCKKSVKIARGSLVEYGNATFIVSTEMDEHSAYLKGKMLKTNRFLKFKYNNVIYSYPALITNQTLYTVGVNQGRIFDTGDGKLSAIVGVNDANREDIKRITRNMRFIFESNGQKIAYKMTFIDSISREGLLICTLQESNDLKPEDTIDIAYNKF